MATIVTKNSSTASAVPTTSDLVQGELAVNVTDKRIFTENASTQIVELGTNPSTVTTATATVTGTLTANGTFASSNAVITGGSVNSTPIGASTASTVRGTTVTATTGFVGGLTGNVTGNLTGNITGNVAGNLTGNVTGNVTASSGTTTLNDLVVNGTADFTNTKLTNVVTPTVGTDAANKSYVDDTVAAVIDSAPAALDTLNELAAALGDDANFAGTVTTALATKLPLAGGTMTGAIAMGTSKITGLGDPTSAQDAATKTYVDTADALKLNLTGGTMSGAIAMGTNKITGVGNPTLAQDAATKDYVDDILGSATSAATSAAAAATSASNAATSASNAASSATASSNSATSAAASYDAFDDRYLGSKASDPVLDNDGNALLTGALYFNSTSDDMKVYTGSTWKVTGPNPDSPVFVDTVTAPDFDLDAIAETKAVTAVDVFVYDTSKDSDGGAWRKRTQNTSWYNETLDTATRGSRKEFPAVAVIVIETLKITIYDGDDPSLPMWMVFAVSGSTSNLTWLGRTNIVFSSVTMRDGILAFGSNGDGDSRGLHLAYFVSDRLAKIGNNYAYNSGFADGFGLVDRNSGSTAVRGTANAIVNSTVNDVAMTVLPNAPIDAATGLPVPTIAVATAGGVSVIKDDGTVADITSSSGSYTYSFNVAFDGLNLVMQLGAAVPQYPGSYIYVFDGIPASDTVITLNTKTGSTVSPRAFYSYNSNSLYYDLPLAGSNALYGSPDLYANNVFNGLNNGIVYLDENPTTPTEGMVAYTTSTYNTGWMVGDTKLATLSDTDDTNVTGSQLVTNGDFATDSDWTKGAGWAISGGEATFTPTNTNSSISQVATGLVVGKTYTYSLTVTTSATTAIRYGGSSVTAVTVNPFSGTQTLTQTFVAAATSTTLGLNALNGDTTLTLDNISLRIAEEDRSVNDKGLQVFGTITKDPVASGADLVAYSGFAATSYLEQPYNSGLDFGTGDFCIMGWAKQSSGFAPFIRGVGLDPLNGFDRTGASLHFFCGSTGNVTVYFNGSAVLGSPNFSINSSKWTLMVCSRKSGVVSMYIDGRKTGSTTNTTDLTDVGAVTRIGYTTIASALWRVSATAPTDEQVAKIYNDEKFLFQENVQATLYGSYDSVTALAYDDDTELLHVGTSAGRSVFNGLHRVDNTTGAVGVAISASNNFIVEE
jgi:trimeric autotransporter adhesin